jgi:hypothetical protein
VIRGRVEIGEPITDDGENHDPDGQAREAAMKLLGLASVPLLLAGSLLGLIVLIGSPSTAGPTSVSLCSPAPSMPPDALALDDEQLAHAATIIEVGRSRGVPPRAWVIALAAAMQESSLRNLPYGDRDSAGLFQMRPSMGWGTFAQVTDPTYAATAFYGGPDVPPDNPGLLDVDGWQQLSIAEAAQAVERSAYPDAYSRWADDAARLVAELSGESLECSPPTTSSCSPSGLAAEAGLTPDAVLVVRCAAEHFNITDIGGRATGGHVNGSDHYTGRGVDLMVIDWQSATGAQFGDEVAAYYVDKAEAFGITYLIWRGQIWSTARPSWRRYSHPDGRTDPTALHMDHLHISVAGHASITSGKETSS